MATIPMPNRPNPLYLFYSESELAIVSRFLAKWHSCISHDLCQPCMRTLSHNINDLLPTDLLGTGNVPLENFTADNNGHCHAHSTSSHVDEMEDDSLVNQNDGIDNSDPPADNMINSKSSLGAVPCLLHKGSSTRSQDKKSDADKHSDGSLGSRVVAHLQTDGPNEWSHPPANTMRNTSPFSQEPNLPPKQSSPRKGPMSLDNKAEKECKIQQRTEGLGGKQSHETAVRRKTELSRQHKEYIHLKRKKDFVCLKRFNGKTVNILQGLELYTGVFSDVEQEKIVSTVYEFQEKGRRGELKDHTYSAPKRWLKDKGRQTIQFGCCYNYTRDKNGNPPGISEDTVDPMPPLFKEIIKRLVKLQVLPPSCVPDSCIINIYEEGDCIPPHIDNHDFLRPFCTISFLSECNILFGTELKVVGAGEFSGDCSIPLPTGSVLVLNGNGADIAKHCVPSVRSRRISITFRKMAEDKRPSWFVPESDRIGINPHDYTAEFSSNSAKRERTTNTRRQRFNSSDSYHTTNTRKRRLNSTDSCHTTNTRKRRFNSDLYRYEEEPPYKSRSRRSSVSVFSR